MSEVGAAVDTGGMPSAAPPFIIPEAMAKDLVAAWAELGNVAKLRQVDAGRGGRYTYADLADVLDVVRPVLARHNLAVLQPLSRFDESTIIIHTLLVHGSGHVLEWMFRVSAGQTAQQTGSALTYGRRYALTAALGVAAGGDDDGAAASAAPHVPESFDEAPLAPTRDQTATVVRLFEQLEIMSGKDREMVTAAILDRPERAWRQLTRDEARSVIEGLQERVDEELRASSDAVGTLLDE